MDYLENIENCQEDDGPSISIQLIGKLSVSGEFHMYNRKGHDDFLNRANRNTEECAFSGYG